MMPAQRAPGNELSSGRWGGPGRPPTGSSGGPTALLRLWAAAGQARLLERVARGTDEDLEHGKVRDRPAQERVVGDQQRPGPVVEGDAGRGIEWTEIWLANARLT